MQLQSLDFSTFYAEIFLAAVAVVVLLLSAQRNHSNPKITEKIYNFATLSLFLAAIAKGVTITFSLANAEVIFGGFFIETWLASLGKIVIFLFTGLILLISKNYLQTRHIALGEFCFLVLSATLGMVLMISSAHIVALYVGIELMSLSFCAAIALEKKSEQALEAAMKYFVLGAIASGFLLYGISLIYGALGSLNIHEWAMAIQQQQITSFYVLSLGIVFVVVATAFKMGLAPFHMWVPDVYQGSATPTALLLASLPKLTMILVIFKLMVSGLAALSFEWQQLFLILAMISIAVGNIGALVQTNFKRLLAYSGIANMGFAVLPLGLGFVDSQPVLLFPAYHATIFYVLTYQIMIFGALGLLIAMTGDTKEFTDIADIKGLHRTSPKLAILWLAILLSLAGIPFLIGFFAKLNVLQVLLIAADVVSPLYYAVTLWILVFSLVGAFYYLRLIRFIYFDDFENDTSKERLLLLQNTPISISSMAPVAIGVIFLIFISLFPNKIMLAVQFLLNTQQPF